MQGYDLFMLVVLVTAVIWGYWKGLAWQVASIVSLSLSYYVAFHFRNEMAAILNRNFAQITPPLDVFLAMLLLFLATAFVVWIGFNLVSEGIEKVKLKDFDHQIGGLLGAAKGAMLCALITLFGVTLLSEPQKQMICNSRSGYYIAVLLDRANPLMPTEVHDVLAPYIKRLDEELESRPGGSGSGLGGAGGRTGLEQPPTQPNAWGSGGQPSDGQTGYEQQPSESADRYSPPTNSGPSYVPPGYARPNDRQPNYNAPQYDPQTAERPRSIYDPSR